MPVLKERYGDKVRLAVYGPKRTLFSRFGATLANGVADTIEERGLWARFGL